MDLWMIWLIVAVALIILEVLTQMVWTLCMAIGCAAALVASFLGADIVWQLVVLSFSSVLSFVWLMPLFKRWHEESAKKMSRDDRTGMDALLGRRALVTESIHPGKLGRVRIDGDNWQVSASGYGYVIESGREVVVTSYDSIVLHVRPL